MKEHRWDNSFSSILFFFSPVSAEGKEGRMLLAGKLRQQLGMMESFEDTLETPDVEGMLQGCLSVFVSSEMFSASLHQD